jgi:hypothetical protein
MGLARLDPFYGLFDIVRCEYGTGIRHGWA